MAQDVNKIIDDLTDAAYDASELANNKDLAGLIDNLTDIADSAAGFGGEIARILPTRVRAQIESLTQVFNTLQTASQAASKELNSLIDVLDNIPLGKLRKTGLANSIINNPTNNAAPVEMPSSEPVTINANTQNAPQSAIVQNESIWGSLKANFRETTENVNGFSFNALRESIPENADLSIIDPNANKQMSLMETVMASLPKNAGDINSAPDPREKEYDDFMENAGEYMPDPELSRINETLVTSNPGVVAPVQTYNISNNAAANIDFSNLTLDENDDGVSFGPDMDDNNGVVLNESMPSKEPTTPTAKSYDIDEDELASKIVD